MNNYKLIFKQRLRDLLKRIDDPISERLLFLDNNMDHGFPMTFFDMDDNDYNMITFTPVMKIKDFKSVIDWNKNRNKQKFGRFISKFLNEDPKDIENFINKYKAEIKRLNNLDDFEIVEGKNIKKFYHYSTYSKGSGSLNKSCMRHDHCQSYFDFYEINGDKVKLIVLYDKGRKILGRALLWDIDEPKIKLMDRIYTVKESDFNLFFNLAKKNNWYYKKAQSFNEKNFISPEKKNVNIKCKVYIKNVNYETYPYLDTFYYLDKKNLYLTNDEEEYYNNKYIVKVRATDGREQGNENFVYDDYNKDYIKSGDSVYCEIGDCRIYMKDAIKIGNKFARPDYIVYSEYENNIYSKDDVVWSNNIKSYILKDNSFLVYFDSKNNEYDYYHHELRGEKFEYVTDKNKYYIKDIVIKGIDNNFYLKDFYDEKEIKKNMEYEDEYKKSKDFNNFFDLFIEEVSKPNVYKNDYGVYEWKHR